MQGKTKKIIAFANQKGGVAKTTTTRNIATAMVQRGQRVLVVDFDPQGALTIGLSVNPLAVKKTIYNVLVDPEDTSLSEVIIKTKNGIDIAPANIDLSGAEVELLNEVGNNTILKEALAAVQGDYDYILIDCPPSLGLLTINALTAADNVFIPVQCQFLAYRGMQLLLRTIEKVQRRANPTLQILGILPTLYDVRNTHSKEVLGELRTHYPQYLIDIPIRYRIGIADAIIDGQSILELDPHSDVAEAFRQVAEVIEHK